MAIALPLAGAFLGGFAGYAGFASMTAIGIGASVGWLVGSWAMMSMMDFKNDPIDSGAQEAPRFNSAVRGSIVPILFGTNRVPGQIVWQDRFEVIRNETSGGGGGKAKKGGGAPSSVSYTYKMDAIYHLGMPVDECVLLGGWLNGKKVNDDSIIAISTNGSAFMSLPDETTVGISYDEGIFFEGDISEASTWPHLTSRVGAPIVWPGTSWVGLKGIDLGQSPSLLQLNFEIGPAGGNFRASANPISHHATDLRNAKGIDVNLNTYYANSRNQCFDVNGNVVWDMSFNDFKQLFITAGAAGLGGSPSITQCIVKPLRNGTKLLYLMETTNSHTVRRTWYVGIGELPTSAGTPSITNYLWFEAYTQIDAVANAWEHFDVFGVPEAIVFASWRSDSAGTRLFWLPSLEKIESGLYKGTHPGCTGTLVVDQAPGLIIELTHSDWLRVALTSQTHSSTEQSCGSIFGLSILGSHRMYVYQNKSYMSIGGNPSWYTGLRTNYGATYPNGAMFYWTGTYDYDTYVWPVGAINEFVNNATAATVDNSSWIDDDGNSVIPFTDENIRLFDAGTPTGSNQPVYSGIAYTERLNEFTYLVAFQMMDSDPTYTTVFGEEVLYSSLRVFYFDPATSKWKYIGKKYGPILTQGDLGFTWDTSGLFSIGPPYTTQAIRVNSKIYLQIGFLTEGVLTEFGTLDLSSHDVTPPYIIKNILVNEVFGLQPGADIIDSTSYDVAVAYCELNNIKVSTQYRRSAGALSHIELLLAIYGGWLGVNMATGKIKFGVMDLQNTPVRTIDNDHLLIRQDGEPPVRTSEGALQDTFNIIRINFINREMDYQNDQAEVRDEVDEDLTGPRPKEFPPDFVMTRDLAEWIADRSLWTNLHVRNAHQFYLGWKDSDLEPGDIITLVDSFSGLNEVAQIVFWNEVDRGVYEVTATQQVPYVAGLLPSQITSLSLATGTLTSSVGYLTGSGTITHSGIVTDPSCRYVFNPIDAVPTPQFSNAYELPAEFSNDQRIWFGWRANALARGANLYMSPDGVSYSLVKNVEPYPISGKLLTELVGNEDQVYAEDVVVIIQPATSWSVNSPSYSINTILDDVTEAGMHSGVGLFYCGSEMLAYTGVNLVSQNKYRLDRVYRGWGGTKKSYHASGDDFNKHGAGIFDVSYTEDQIGTLFYWKIAPYNMAGYAYDVSSIAAQTYTIKGQHFRPASPSAIFVNSLRGVRKINVGSAGDILLSWLDGARKAGHGAGGYGTNPGLYGGFTMDTTSHAWRVVVTGSGNTVVRSTVVGSPYFLYTNSMNAADNGAWRGNVGVSVTAFGAYGDSPRSRVASLELFF